MSNYNQGQVNVSRHFTSLVNLFCCSYPLHFHIIYSLVKIGGTKTSTELSEQSKKLTSLARKNSTLKRDSSQTIYTTSHKPSFMERLWSRHRRTAQKATTCISIQVTPANTTSSMTRRPRNLWINIWSKTLKLYRINRKISCKSLQVSNSKSILFNSRQQARTLVRMKAETSWVNEIFSPVKNIANLIVTGKGRNS